MFTPLSILATQQAAVDRRHRRHRDAADSRRGRTPIAPELIRVDDLARLVVGEHSTATIRQATATAPDASDRRLDRGVEQVA